MNEALDPKLERAIRYAEGEMDAQEREAFEEQMRADPLIADDVAAARRAIGALRALGAERLRADLKNTGAELSHSKAGPASRWWWAAAATLVVAASVWFVLREGEADPQQLAEAYTIAEPGLPVLMGAQGNSMDAIMNAYKQGDDAVAAQLIETALERTPGNDTLLYFSGILQTRLQNCPLAIARLAEVGSASRFAVKANYHHAICLLRMNRPKDASIRLDAVVAANDPQLSSKARELRDRLQRK